MEYTIILHPKNRGKCYVCTALLSDYLENLNDDFYDYEVQRGIVQNKYLDSLTDTIDKGELIPPITLVSQEVPQVNNNSLVISKSDILDGLQRTFRLWVLNRIKQIVEEKQITTYRDLVNYLKQEEEGKLLLRYEFIKPKLLKMYFSDIEGEEAEMIKRIRKWNDYSMIFYIWYGLDEKETINKMLELNAGQKSMSSTHQYELLFLHYFNKGNILIPDGMQIYRAKDLTPFDKSNREQGKFQLSSIIVAYISFIEKRPTRVDSANELNNRYYKIAIDKGLQLDEYFSPEALSRFLELIYEIDSLLCTKEPSNSTWYGKDTTLAGIYAALGKFIEDDSSIDLDYILNFICRNKLRFNYEEFQKAYKEMSSMTVNVGNVVRKAVYSYTLNVLKQKPKTWSECFSREGETL